MKKILLITNRLVIGGPSRHVAMLAKALQRNYEVLVVGGSAAPGEVLALELFEGLNNNPILIYELSRKLSLSRDYMVYRRIRKIIQEFQPDIVHTHTSKVGALGRYAAKKEGVNKIIHSYHGLIFENYFSGILNVGIIKLDRYLATFTHSIIALSKSQKAALADQYNITASEDISVIPLGMETNFDEINKNDYQEFRNKYSLDNDTITIGIIGRLVKIKNIKLFLDAIKYIRENSKLEIRAFIIGDGAEKSTLMTYAQDIGLDYSDNANGDLVFTSWLSDLQTVYSNLDIVALTSLSEGTPMSLMEAQMAGKAIIASNVGGVADIVKKSTGILFDINKPQELFDGLLKLVESEELRNNYGKKAKEHALKTYDKDLMISRIEDVYQA